jgi:hypothetical protein
MFCPVFTMESGLSSGYIVDMLLGENFFPVDSPIPPFTFPDALRIVFFPPATTCRHFFSVCQPVSPTPKQMRCVLIGIGVIPSPHVGGASSLMCQFI